MLRPQYLSLLSVSILCALHSQAAIAEPALPILPETETQTENQPDTPTLDRQQLEQIPVGNNTLSQVLKDKPGIGIDDGQTGLRGGDIAPEEISVSGARPHQTKYMLNGMGINNITTFSHGAGSEESNLTSGHTSGYFLDTNLIEEIDVHDRNVSAEFGGFTGGVINAQLRQPQDDFTIEYRYRMTDSDWNGEPKTSEKDTAFHDNAIHGDGRYQPDYQKRFHSLHLSGAVNDNHKLGINVSRQESDIPLHNGKDIGQGIDSLFITHVWQSGAWKLTNDLRYSGYESKAFLNDMNRDNVTQEDSASTSTHSGIGATVKLEREMGFGRWETTLAFDRLTDKRDSEANYLRNTFDMPNGFSRKLTGGYDSIKQEQDSWQLKTVTRFDPIYVGATKHTVNLGIDAAWHKATATRSEDYFAIYHTKMFGGMESIGSLTHFKAGSYDASTQQYALFVDEKLEWNRLTVNGGARVEHMALFDETVVSPRLATSWDFDTTQTNRVTVGASRYYSGSLLGWALKAQGNKLVTTNKKCVPINGDYSSNDINDYQCDSTQKEPLSLAHADTPYANEYSVDWSVDVSNFNFTTGYLLRQQRKGLSYHTPNKQTYAELKNNVESDSHIYSIKAATIEPYDIAKGKLSGFLEVAYIERNGYGNTDANYDSDNNLNVSSDDEWVLFDGQLMRRNEMESGGYHAPVKATLGLNMHWADYGVSFNNRVNYEQGKDLTIFRGKDSVDINGTSENVTVIESAQMEDLITWDMAMNWTPQMLKNNNATIGLTVTNVLDESAKISTSGNIATHRVTGKVTDNTMDKYSKGREVWLNLTIRN